MNKLKQYTSTLILIIKYCITHKSPFFATFHKLKEIRNQEHTGYRFLIETDYLSHPDTFYLLESYYKKCRSLNSEKACDLLDNKTTLYKRCPHLLGRDCLILTECSEQEKIDFIRTHTRFVGKRNYGSQATQFACYDTTTSSTEDILESINSNRQVLLEEYIIQHDEIAKIYPHSVNTIRIHTVNNGQEIRSFLKPKLRIGCNNSIVDISENNSGSYRAVINIDGTIDMAVYVHPSKHVEKATIHHNTNIVFNQIKIPYIQESINLAIEAASYFPEVPYIGWDIAVTPTGPIVVEGNAISGCFSTYQQIQYLYHGTGLKKEIDEMLDFGLTQKKQEDS